MPAWSYVLAVWYLLLKLLLPALVAANILQVEFFSSMGLPYHAISDAEYDDLALQLAAVLRACGEWDKAKDM
jgi:hypothetical protein